MAPKPSRSGEYIETDNGNKISRRAQLHATQHIILAGRSVIQEDVIIRGDLVRQQPAAGAASRPSGADPSGKASTSGGSAAAGPSQTQAQAQAQAQTVSIHLGRYVFISPGCTLHPPSRLTSTPGPNPNHPPATTTTTSPNPNPTNPLTSQQQQQQQQPPPSNSLGSTSSDQLSAQAAPPPSAAQTLIYYTLRISSYVYLGRGTYCAAASIGSRVYIGDRCTVENMVIIKDGVRVENDTVLPAGSVWRSGCVVAGRPGRVVGTVGEGWASGGGGGDANGGEGGGGGGVAATTTGGMEELGRLLWASVGNHVKKREVGLGPGPGRGGESGTVTVMRRG